MKVRREQGRNTGSCFSSLLQIDGLSQGVSSCPCFCWVGIQKGLSWVVHPLMGVEGTFPTWLLQSRVWHLGDPFFGGWGVPHRACRILVPRPGIEPTLLAVKAWSPKHWTIREFLPGCSLTFIFLH